MNCAAEEVCCDRSQNAELFALIVGGFGLFGVICEIALQLVEHRQFRRTSAVRKVSQVIADLKTIRRDCDYGDMQLDIDSTSSGFLSRGVLNVWQPSEADAEKEVNHAPNWERFITFAHTNKGQAFQEYCEYAESVDGSLATRKDFHWDAYEEGYHDKLDQVLGRATKGSDIVAEYFVLEKKCVLFLEYAKTLARRLGIDLVLATLRTIKRCDVSFLRWADKDYVCLALTLHVNHTEPEIKNVDSYCASLCQFSCANGGKFYLTYRSVASREDIKQAYPNIGRFVSLKHNYDPVDVFGNDWFEGIKRHC